jgi:hypothetical protein
MKPDPESGQEILISKIFTLDHADNLQLGKTADRSIPRPITRESPRIASAGETLAKKISKAGAPRDTKHLFRGVDEKTHNTVLPYEE